MDIINDLRLVTLIPTENQTIYAFNVNNPNEYYSESFFAKMGSTWAFCVIPTREDNDKEYFVNIVQSDNQTITVNAIIPDVVIQPEFRAGIMNYYSTDSSDRYTYTISYQQIRVFATAVTKSNVEVDYKTITPVQVDHQLILIVDDTNRYYSYEIDLPVGSRWKAVLIVEPGYIAGKMTYQKSTEHEPTEIEYGTIINRFVDYDLTISATEATELFSSSTMKIGLFDNSTTDYSNSDGWLKIGIGTETSKKNQTILLYTKNKLENDGAAIGTNPNKLLYAALGDREDYNASNLIYKTNTQSRSLLFHLPGYYGYDYILGYAQVIPSSSMSPTTFSNGSVSITIKAFGFACEQVPVNDLSECYYLLVIDNPGTEKWNYIKISIRNGSNVVFSMYALREYFEEITEGQFTGQLIFKQNSKNGINDSAYIYLLEQFTHYAENNKVTIGVSLV